MDHFYSQISGMVSEAELDLFRHCIAKIPDGGRFVEIGLWFGHCTAFLEVEIVNSGKKIELISIDTFPCSGQEQMLRLIALPFVQVIKGQSLEYKSPADVIWLDGDHTYENVKKELDQFWPLINPGGILCGHDYADFDPYKGVFNAVNEFAEKIGQDVKKFGDYSWYFDA